MTLRRAGPGDLPALAELALLLWPGHTRDALEAELRDTLAGERGCWRRGRIGPGAWAAGSLPATAH